MDDKIVLCKDQSAMKKFAAAFSAGLKAGDIVELIGDLGSGKTFFTRALAEALGASGISSPSYVIRNKYEGDKFPILHFDFYRVEDPEMVIEELREDIKRRDSLIIIEWADSVKNILPDERYKIHFKVKGDDSRELSLHR